MHSEFHFNLRANFSAECLSTNLSSSTVAANPIKNGETSACMTKALSLADAGMPLMTPVAESKRSPGGSDPLPGTVFQV